MAKLDVFSPEFQSLVTDKGAAILNMLRYAIGTDAFDGAMRTFAQKFALKPATVADFRSLCEQISGQQLGWFFSQWLNSPARRSSRTSTRLSAGQ